MRGVQRFSIHKAYGESGLLPTAHTCFNQVCITLHCVEMCGVVSCRVVSCRVVSCSLVLCCITFCFVVLFMKDWTKMTSMSNSPFNVKLLLHHCSSFTSLLLHFYSLFIFLRIPFTSFLSYPLLFSLPPSSPSTPPNLL